MCLSPRFHNGSLMVHSVNISGDPLSPFLDGDDADAPPLADVAKNAIR